MDEWLVVCMGDSVLHSIPLLSSGILLASPLLRPSIHSLAEA